jgi:hypothetical protein
MTAEPVYFEDVAFGAAWRVFRDTDGTAADCLRAALTAAAPLLAAAERERCAQLADSVKATYLENGRDVCPLSRLLRNPPEGTP